MAGLDPAIHDLLACSAPKTWMAGTSPAMTKWMELRSEIAV
jgi:hypothetical protein